MNKTQLMIAKSISYRKHILYEVGGKGRQYLDSHMFPLTTIWCLNRGVIV